MKTVIVGANHAGIAAANTLLDTYPDQEVVMIDRNTNLSYLGCGTALWVGRQIDSVDKLFYTNKDAFEAKGAQVFMETEVTSIDFDAHLVSCRPRTGADFTIKYDKLVLATGSLPIAPKLPGHDLAGINFLKLFQEGQEVDRQISDDSVRSPATTTPSSPASWTSALPRVESSAILARPSALTWGTRRGMYAPLPPSRAAILLTSW